MESNMKVVFILITLLAMLLSVDAQVGIGGLMSDFEREEFDGVSVETTFDTSMTKEMTNMQNKVWKLDPIPLHKIKDRQLRAHLSNFVNKPLEIKLLGRAAKTNGFRALCKKADGTKLRATWKRGTNGAALTQADLLRTDFDSAKIRKAGTTVVDMEVTLPPLAGRKELPQVVYSVTVGAGASNQDSTVTKSLASITFLPRGAGHKAYPLGQVYVSAPMGAAIVDPSWVKGKTIFRKGRSVGRI
jgi:hypothetical protein